jgi:hypothetical protein
MSSSIATAQPWPNPLPLALRCVLAFAIATSIATLWGRQLIALTLPYVHTAVPWLDDHFAVLALDMGDDKQDSIIRLRVTLVKAIPRPTAAPA